MTNNQANKTIYAFIDAQNLHSGVNNSFTYFSGKGKKSEYNGWKLDMRKLFIYLQQKHNVSKAFLFMGDDPNYSKMRQDFKSYGYEIVLKPHITDKSGKVKGNCDAELVLHACKIQFKNYDRAVIISGDGDFYCLVEDLIKEQKLASLFIPNEFRYSRLYNRLSIPYITYVNRLHDKISINLPPR
jgi:uncharacterized LabA/DUF88 family protein